MGKSKKNRSAFVSSYYDQAYRQTHYTGLLGAFTNGYHARIEAPYKASNFEKIIEVGANQGEHLIHVKSSFTEYYMIDICYPNETEVSYLYENLGSEQKSTVVKQQGNAENLNFQDDTFDRAIYSCVLNHLENSNEALTEIRRVVKNNGSISIYLPCDPGITYRALRHLISHRKQVKVQRKSMAEVKYIWSIEHKNHFAGLMAQTKWIFRDDELAIKRYPLPGLSWNLNLFYIVHVRLSKSKKN